MIDDNKMVKVTNRDSGIVTYILQDSSGKSYIKRRFVRNQTREVPFKELKELSYQNGGLYMIKHLLRIEDKDAIEELIGNVEPEYNYTEEDVKNLLLRGSDDELLDCLNFAPVGVIEILKKLAVDLKIDSMAKRKLITEKTGFNISNAIDIEEQVENDLKQGVVEKDNSFSRITPNKAEQPTRATEKETKKRVAEPPKYQRVQ